ncbi:hypothetical protein GUJ75_25650, partial|uniref:hypothetical protein n=1 Tax=Escherichia coli TaxID=562 RepID=UPI0016A1F7CD
MTPFTKLPGLVGEIVDYMVASSQNPCPVLALAAALPVVGVVAGRNYKSPSNLRTNFYCLGLPDSGFGKDHQLNCVLHLLGKAGLLHFLGGSTIMSGSAMRKRVEAQASIMWSMDEFGGFNRKINNPRDPHAFQ